MRCFGWLVLVASLGVQTVLAQTEEKPQSDVAAAAERPNIVVILADDLGYGDLGCYSDASKIPTPNLDRLASEGRRFTDAHSPSSVCTPTRYGILTGRYCWRSRLKGGVLYGESPNLIRPGRLTLASLLKQHRYATGCIGKWHLGFGSAKKTDYSRPLDPGPLQHGFDSFFGIPASLDLEPYLYVEDDRALHLPTEKIDGSEMRRQGGDGFWRGGRIAPGFSHIDVLPTLAEKAAAFVDARARERETPFFLYLALSAPHTPWLPTPRFVGASEAGPYGDFTAQVDWTVGRVLAALDRNCLTENTLVIFTSDNGAHWLPGDIDRYGHRANGALRGQKADIWEGGHRVPFIARWPGRVQPGTRCDETICQTDLLATTAGILGVDLPDDAGEDSFDIGAALLGRPYSSPLREATVHHSGTPFFAIRQGNWKLVLGRGSGGFSTPQRIEPQPGEAKGQLYDLAQDPSEKRNLYLEKPKVVEKMTELLERYQRTGRSRGVREKAVPGKS